MLLKAGKYRDKAAQFSKMAKRMNGAKKAADIIIDCQRGYSATGEK